MPNKCPYCDYETPTSEPGAARGWQEVAHMQLDHPEIIRERLEKAGILDISVRFHQEDKEGQMDRNYVICEHCGGRSVNLASVGAGLYCEHCGEPSAKGRQLGARPPLIAEVSDEPPTQEEAERALAFMKIQRTEHEAWGAVVSELRKRGVDDINQGGKDESLHDAIVAWAEELAHLRMNDPDPMHAVTALRERREKYLTTE